MEKANVKKTIRNFLSRQSVMPWLFIAPALIMIMAFYLYPIGRTVYISFRDYNALNPTASTFIGFSNYLRIFEDDIIRLALMNSIVYVVVSLVLQSVLGCTLAFLLWKNFRGKGLYQAFVFIPWAIAGFLIGITFRWMFNSQYGVFSDLLSKLGFMDSGMSILSNPDTALIGPIIGCVWFGIPYFAIMTLSALQGVSTEMLEASHIDGVNWFGRIFRIVIPTIKPTLIITLLLRAIWIFNSADIIYIMTNGGPVNSTQTISSYLFQLAYTKHDYALVSALSIVIMICMLLYTALYLFITKFDEAGDN